MEGFVAEWGGDAILFPDLRGQPLMDAWLGEEVGDDIPGLVPRSPVASLPNRFLALVPAERAEGLARQAETDLRAAVGEYATTCVGAFVEHYSQGAVLGEWVQRAVREAKETVSCHWYVLPWQGESDGLRELSERVLGRGIHDFWCTLDGLRDVAAYRPNRGTYFAVQSALVEAGHGAVKASRPFGQFGDGETARRCTVCGTGGGLWDPRGRDAPKPGRALKEGEALCGLCAARRQAPKSRWAGELCGETIQFPSTHNLAASRFMENVLDCIARVAEGRGAAEDQGLVEQLRRFVDRVSEVDRAYASPWLFERAMGCGDADLAAGFVKMPAELLVPESYGDEDTLRELGFAGDPKAAGIALSAFLGACAEVGISRAGRYYAAMVMDGDRMGQWLSGQLAPEIGEVLHEGARPPGDPAYLRLRRPLSSAHQVAVSRALNEFSLGIVRPLVERVHGGVVVYAGGDDLLALLPLHRLIPCLRDLRRLYSGLPLPEGSDASKRGYEAGSGFVRRGGRLWRVMGEKATCSMGVAIAHQKWPLRHALETARSTEKYAKESLGRNAVTIALLKRSGGYETFGARWGEEHGIAEPDPLAVVDSVVALIREDLVSRRFAYALHEEAPVIWHLPGALEERAYWLIDRHWRKRQRPFNRERALAVARGLAGLADRLKAEKPGDKADVTADGRGAIPRFQAALGLAEFIGRDVRGGAV
jgi:CRISPR-associated protein Cmr2